MMSGVEPTSATQGCLHEYVEEAFKDVVRVLQARATLLGAPATSGEPGAEDARPGFVHRGLASLPVEISGVAASVVVVRVVGGRQAPITELILVSTPADAGEPPPALARGFADLVCQLERELRAVANGEPTEESQPPAAWPPRQGQARILIESHHARAAELAETMLRRAGYDTARCGGPGQLPHQECPLVATGRCPLVEGADLIVHALDPDQPAHADVLHALRRQYPDTPVVAAVPASAAARHDDLLDGWIHAQSLLKIPPTLLGTVDKALSRPRSHLVA